MKTVCWKRLHTLQVDLLSRAIKIASSGSVIVYSTCSLDPIENEAVISRILENEKGVELEQIDVETLNGLTYRNGMMNWTVLDDEINPIEDERFEPSKNLEIRKIYKIVFEFIKMSRGMVDFLLLKSG